MPAPTIATIEKTVREDWGRILASLTKTLGDLQLAEDCLQDAVESALIHWTRNGLPASAAGWLIQTARRKAIDRIRRQQNFRSKQAELTHLMELDAQANAADSETGRPPDIQDKRLEMIFTCCHPAIEEKSRFALTLRTLGGLSTEEIARAFLDKPETMAARLTRARKKIALAGIPYEVPAKEHLPARLDSVLGVIYLIFNEGYHASREDELIRADLVGEALRLGELVHALMPHEPETAGLLALLRLHSARHAARLDAQGNLVAIEEQDRALWDHGAIAEASHLLKTALAAGRVGPYQLQAAISACHCEAANWAATDWHEIIALYGVLERISPNPVIRLNRIAAACYILPPEPLLAELEMLGPELSAYQPYHAACAELYRRAGRGTDAKSAYRRAISLSSNSAERKFLATRLEALDCQ